MRSILRKIKRRLKKYMSSENKDLWYSISSDIDDGKIKLLLQDDGESSAKKVIYFRSNKSRNTFIKNVSNSTFIFNELSDDYQLRFKNTEYGLRVNAHQTSYFDPLKQKQLKLKRNMQAFIGNVMNEEAFCLVECNYNIYETVISKKQMALVKDKSRIELAFYNECFLMRGI